MVHRVFFLYPELAGSDVGLGDIHHTFPISKHAIVKFDFGIPDLCSELGSVKLDTSLSQAFYHLASSKNGAEDLAILHNRYLKLDVSPPLIEWVNQASAVII